MALQGDQRALLQLLVERGQSYEDISGLLGSTAEDVRSQARAALTEIGGADPDEEVGLTDYLLGQADPIGRADAVRYLQGNPEAHALAVRIEDGLREIAPSASLPKLPEPRGKPRRAAVPSGPAAAAADRPSTSSASTADDPGGPAANRQTRIIGAIAGAGVILVVAILAIAGVFGGDDDDPAGTPSASTETTTGEDGTTTTAEATNVTEVKLKPVGDSGVAGTAGFGIANQSQLYVDLSIDGLDPEAPRDSTYFFWLMIGEEGGYPLNEPLVPDENGRYSGRIAVPTAVAQTVAGQAQMVKVSLSPVDELAAAAKEAARQQVPIVGFTGDELAAGEIPLAEAAAE